MLIIMDELSQEQIDNFRQDLLNLKEELEQNLKSTEAQAKPVDLDQPIGRLSRIDAIQNQQIAKAGKRNQEMRLRLVMAAINNLEDGDYGLCIRCDGPIDLRRLKARPEARMCIDCARESERS
jgi:DnaK suppressor protein